MSLEADKYLIRGFCISQCSIATPKRCFLAQWDMILEDAVIERKLALQMLPDANSLLLTGKSGV